MDLDERVHELLADAPALGRRGERRRQLGGDDHALDLLHHVEGRPDHRLVRAGEQDARRAHAPAVDRGEQPRLAQDVVGRGRQRWARRAAQDDLRAPAGDEVGQVRVALAYLGRVERAAPDAVCVEQRLERSADEQRRTLQGRRLLERVDDGRRGAGALRRRQEGLALAPRAFAAWRAATSTGS